MTQTRRLLATAFATDESFASVYPRPQARMRALRRIFAAAEAAGHATGGVDVVHRDGRLAGAALWVRQPWSVRVKAAAALRYLPVAAADPTSVRRQLAFAAASDAVHPREPHWYLLALGVAADARRLGVAGRLLDIGLARADADRLPCYLETHSAAAAQLYARHGFIAREDSIRFLAGGPSFTTMWRAPVSNTSDSGADRMA
jgi:ribosomal protein S18 acetylase RimI-like enzyme